MIPSDTSYEAASFQVSILQTKTSSERLSSAFRLSDMVIHLSKRAIRRTRPHMSDEEVRYRFIELHYGKPLADGLRLYDTSCDMTGSHEMIQALKPVVDFLASLGVTYFIGGSVASSAYGIARSTLDIDMVSSLTQAHVPKLILALKEEYYLSEELIREAIAHSSSFNLIHLKTGLKIDIFITKNRPYDQAASLRSKQDSLSGETDAAKFYLASPEDVVLAKLERFKDGGGSSERQWNDILGVLRVQGDQVDISYLRYWAAQLGVGELLDKTLVIAQS